MALINCPSCGKEISDRGKICPHCKLWIDEKFLAEKKQELIDEGLRQYQQSEEYKQRKEKEARLAKLPVCPICGSNENVNRISTLNRSVSALVWGLGSSKIGKQYECKCCKHKW